jgi:hypothetical protein
MSKVSIDDLIGILPNPYPDIPSEYQLGLDRGRLGDWLQEVVDAGWDVSIEHGGVHIGRNLEYGSYGGFDPDTHRVDIMLVRAYLAWKERAA